MFTTSLYNRTEITSLEDDNGRRYLLPNGDVVNSVTTRIGKSKEFPKDWLKKWQKRIGTEAANQITQQAKNRGSAVHAIAEQYLLNNPDYARGVMPVNLADFKSIKGILDESIDTVHGIEFPLYSYEYKTAGRADLLASWNGKRSVIDFKTSSKEKKEEQILGYFVQASVYAAMASAMYEPITQIVVLIMVSHERPQLYIKNPEVFMPLVNKIFLDAQS